MACRGGVKALIFFSNGGTGWKYLGFNFSWKGNTCRSPCGFCFNTAGKGCLTSFQTVTAAHAWAHKTSLSCSAVFSFFPFKVKICPDHANNPANESVLSYSAGNVSMSPDFPRSDRPPSGQEEGSAVNARSDGRDAAGPGRSMRGRWLEKNPFPEWAFCWGRYADLWVIW